MNGGSYDVPTTRARRTCRAAAVARGGVRLRRVQRAAAPNFVPPAPPRRRPPAPPFRRLRPRRGPTAAQGRQPRLPKATRAPDTMWRRDPGGWRASRTRAARARPGFGADVLIVGAEGGGDGATERREKGRKSGKFEVLRGNQGRSAGGTTEEEHAVPAGEAGDVLRARGGRKGAEKGAFFLAAVSKNWSHQFFVKVANILLECGAFLIFACFFADTAAAIWYDHVNDC